MLSELYTLETLLAEYKESLVLELEKKSVLAASMFEQAELHFEGEKIVCVELLDSIVSEGKKGIYRDASGRGTEPQIWDAGGNPCTLPGAGGKSEPGI